MDDSIDSQYINLNRDYLRTMDNILTNLDGFNQRYSDIEQNRIRITQDNDTNRSTTNRWDYRRSNPFSINSSRRRNRNYTNTSTTRPSYQNLWGNINRQTSTNSLTNPSPLRNPPVIPPPIIAPPRFTYTTPLSFTTPLSNSTETTNNLTNTTGVNTFNNILNNSLYTPSYSNRHPSYNDIIYSTTTMTYREFTESSAPSTGSTPSQTTCPISREEFEPNTVILKINHCGHIFKKNSLLNWFETSSRCPMCRHNIRHSSLQDTNTETNTEFNTESNTESNTNDLNADPSSQESITQDENDNTSASSQNENIDLSGNQLQEILENNLTQVLDNLGNAVLNNLEGVLGQALSGVTDLSNNQIQTGFEYSIQFPTNSSEH